MSTITKQEAAGLITNAGGKIFGVSFIKRTTGELRKGTFRLGITVQKGLRGGSLAYNPIEKGLITAYEMIGGEAANDTTDAANRRRMIPVEGIVELKLDGQLYNVVQ